MHTERCWGWKELSLLKARRGRSIIKKGKGKNTDCIASERQSDSKCHCTERGTPLLSQNLHRPGACEVLGCSIAGRTGRAEEAGTERALALGPTEPWLDPQHRGSWGRARLGLPGLVLLPRA